MASTVPGAPAAVSQLSGPITVGLDFDPNRDGFQFENYTNSKGYLNLTAEELRRYFGDSVCASTADGTCILTPPAQKWMDSTNDGMNGGHCEGMAALALVIKKGQAKASDFGNDVTHALAIDGNDKLAREIAYYFATQDLDPTKSGELKTLKPSEVVARLKESFQPGSSETYTLGIYKTVDGRKKEGHAMTPFGLAELPDGKVEIAVYDNNFPGQTRATVVDPAAEKWSYSTATNPSEPVGLYEGDASTFSLTLTPTAPRLTRHICPFCGEGAGSGGQGARGGAAGNGAASAPGGSGFLFLGDTAFEGGVAIAVTKPDGSPLDGVTERATKGESLAQDDAPPTYEVPMGAPFKVRIDGTNVQATAKTDVTFVGAGTDMYIDGINVDPGQVDEAILDPAAGTITYTTRRTEAPLIGAGFSAEGADYAFGIGGVDLPDGGTVKMTLDRTAGTFSIKNEDEKTGTYALGMSRIDTAGQQDFSDEGFELPSGATVTIDYREWTSKSDKLKVTVDPGNGSPPESSELTSDK